MQVLNSNVGTDKVTIVEYTGTAILTKKYDFNDNSVQATSYFMTDETRNYIDIAYGKPISMGYFLLQISGNSASEIESLEKCASVTVRKEKEMLIARDSESNVIEENIVSSNDSFCRTVQKAVNLESLLNNEYSKGHTK